MRAGAAPIVTACPSDAALRRTMVAPEPTSSLLARAFEDALEAIDERDQLDRLGGPRQVTLDSALAVRRQGVERCPDGVDGGLDRLG
jgi:hypothetical protein